VNRIARFGEYLGGRVVWRSGLRKRAKKKKKKTPKASNVKKTLTMVLCWLTEGQKQDEKKTPNIWTERPTGAVMGTGSLWSEWS
jgi:hypothetical protein